MVFPLKEGVKAPPSLAVKDERRHTFRLQDSRDRE
jgi:hypothetical protein